MVLILSILLNGNRINLCDKSFFYYAKYIYNSLPKSLRDVKKFSVFNYKIYIIILVFCVCLCLCLTLYRLGPWT